MKFSTNMLLNAFAFCALAASSVVSIDAKRKDKECKPLCCEDKAIACSLDRLYEAFLATDEGFNTKGGLTPEEIAALGYYNETSISFGHGPTMQDVCGHINHTLQPGTVAAQGTLGCATLQANFEGAFLKDCLHFPFTDIADAPKIEHKRPVLSHCWGDIFNVNSLVHVTYKGELIAVLHGNAQYKVTRDDCGKIVVPALAWIHFATIYTDCSAACQACFNS